MRELLDGAAMLVRYARGLAEWAGLSDGTPWVVATAAILVVVVAHARQGAVR